MFAITERLLLRPAWPEDVLRLEPVMGRGAASRMRGAPSLGDALGSLFSSPAEPLRPRFLICRRDGGQPVGMIGLHRSAPELSCWIAPDWRDRGLATEATGAVLALCDDSLRLGRIEARHAPGDRAAARLLARAGFELVPMTMPSDAPRLVRHGRPTGMWMTALAA